MGDTASGYIKLWRSMEKWEWYQDANVVRVWLDILLHANHEDRNWQGIVIEAGGVITSPVKIAERLHLSRQNVRTALSKLEKTGEITTKSTNKYTVINVVKWADYQPPQDSVNQQPNKQLTINQPTTNQQLTTNKNVKNVKNEKKNIYISPEVVDEHELWFEKFWQEYPRKVSKSQAQKVFLKKCRDKNTYNLMMNGLHRAINYQWRNKDPQYIPYPATWLNGERWNDEIPISTGNPYLDMLMKETDGNEQTGDNEDFGNDPLSVWKQ